MKKSRKNIWAGFLLLFAEDVARTCTLGRKHVKSTRTVVNHLFPRTTHPFACSALLASLRSIVRSLAHSLARVLLGERFLSVN